MEITNSYNYPNATPWIFWGGSTLLSGVALKKILKFNFSSALIGGPLSGTCLTWIILKNSRPCNYEFHPPAQAASEPPNAAIPAEKNVTSSELRSKEKITYENGLSQAVDGQRDESSAGIADEIVENLKRIGLSSEQIRSAYPHSKDIKKLSNLVWIKLFNASPYPPQNMEFHIRRNFGWFVYYDGPPIDQVVLTEQDLLKGSAEELKNIFFAHYQSVEIEMFKDKFTLETKKETGWIAVEYLRVYQMHLEELEDVKEGRRRGKRSIYDS